jgi:transposase
MSSVMEVVGSGSRSIQRWVMDYQIEGLSGLRPGWRGENAKKLSDEQRADIRRRLEQYRPDQVLSREVRLSRGQFWTVSDVQVAVKTWYGVVYRSEDSSRALLYEAGFSYQRTEGVYRSKPSQVEVAQFEAELEKK